MCNTDFRVEGQWEFVCSNGTWAEDYRESASRCVPMTRGEFYLSDDNSSCFFFDSRLTVKTDRFDKTCHHDMNLTRYDVDV